MKFTDDVFISIILILVLFFFVSAIFFPKQKQTFTEYEKIDFHEHFIAGGNFNNFFVAMKVLNITSAVFLPTGNAPNNIGYKENMQELLIQQKIFPDKIFVYCTIDQTDDNATAVLEECVKNGGIGLKLLGGLPSYYIEQWNSSRMYKVYDNAAELKIPVLLHIEARNKRQAEEFSQVLKDFPNVTFIFAHYCKEYAPPTFEFCSSALEKYPNVYIDISIGNPFPTYLSDVHNNTEKYREFLIKFQDRILWGADLAVSTSKTLTIGFYVERIKCDQDVLEKEFFRCSFAKPPFNSTLLRGLNLPNEVLEKIYLKNPQKIIVLKK